MSLNIKIHDGRHLPIPFFPVLSHITHITCWISHEKLIVSKIYFLVSFLVFWRALINKFKMATSGQIENLTPKKIFLETGIISLFLLIIAHRVPFWHHLCILTGLNAKTQDGHHLSFPLSSDLSHSIHCSCWMSHQKLVSGNICWFYVLLLHIFPQWSPRSPSRDN